MYVFEIDLLCKNDFNFSFFVAKIKTSEYTTIQNKISESILSCTKL